LDDSRGHQLVWGRFHRFGIALLLDGIRRKNGTEELWMGQHPGCAGSRSPCNVACGLNVQFQTLSNRLKAVGLLIDAIGESVGDLCKFALSLLLFQIGFNLPLISSKLRTLGRLDIGQANDVITKLRLDYVTDIAFLHGKCGVFERLHHRASGEKVEIPAVGGRAGVLRVLSGKLGEAVG
jgi:hypothetical protein